MESCKVEHQVRAGALVRNIMLMAEWNVVMPQSLDLLCVT